MLWKTPQDFCLWRRSPRTLTTEWASARKYTSHERAEALAPWLNFYNTERIHTGIGQAPLSQVSPTS
ncbi:integrase core domain-containing protein [Cryobacterium roopkundense]|uniref:integrase core domain-containing protein n=1 Tax=Cryobacterium roopkundense TaxID=1001240 RepID=UPI000A01135F|nr:integrase core domain-containing protein [Cryobacterium roopkundense]